MKSNKSNKSNILILLCCFFLNVSLNAQKITAYDEFHGTKSLSKIEVEEDLYLRFDLEKNLSQLAQEQGISSTNSIYAAIKMTLGNTEISTGTFLLASGKTSLLKSFDLVWSVNHKQFHGVVAQHQDNWSSKDDLLMKVMAQPQNPMGSWFKLIAVRVLEGEVLNAKIELSLCNSPENNSALGSPIATGTFQVNAKKTALTGLYGTRIPAMNRPMADNGITSDTHKKNIGNIAWNKINEDSKPQATTSFTYGEDKVSGNIFLPKSVGNISKNLGMFKQCELLLELSMNNEGAQTVVYPLPKDICSKETVLSLLLQDPESEEKTIFQKQLAALMKDKKAGKHDLKIRVFCEYNTDAEKNKIQLASAPISIVKK